MTMSNPPDFTEAWRQSWEEWSRAWTGLAASTGGDTASATSTPTPAEAWKRSMDRWLNSWSTFLEETMTRPEFAAGYGRTLDTMLNVQKPLREATESTMQRALDTLNMPSRHDIVRLAGQVNEVNARLDDLSDKVDEILDALAALTAARGEPASTEAPVASGARSR